MLVPLIVVVCQQTLLRAVHAQLSRISSKIMTFSTKLLEGNAMDPQSWPGEQQHEESSIFASRGTREEVLTAANKRCRSAQDKLMSRCFSSSSNVRAEAGNDATESMMLLQQMRRLQCFSVRSAEARIECCCLVPVAGATGPQKKRVGGSS